MMHYEEERLNGYKGPVCGATFCKLEALYSHLTADKGKVTCPKCIKILKREGKQMAATCSCEKCKFSDQAVLKANKRRSEQKPYCTYPGKLDLNREGDCQSGREV